jgi:hypothetical protein
VTDPVPQQIFRHSILAEMRDPESPEAVKANLPVGNLIESTKDIPLSQRAARLRGEEVSRFPGHVLAEHGSQ